ncbi:MULTISPECIES: YafY family protein [Nocardioides]|uniref:WYL domain-containing protein n=3 Tax=Nocardioides kribbensis TaxID=305517 RepID=A0ABV1NUQ6_9ACTN|nr:MULTISPECIES: WYL domain-containing protein [Nocardioides]KQP64882.1 transcriptional regulator [Nocardioides sp. Leaf285]KQQ43901.1 transcriptional regulator [Nocardioides sp. Leaf307]MCM3515280.1 WYL domain-containing protein [Nocardioides sp. P86]
MSVRKSERLLNLLIMLLVQRHFVPKERIRSILYPGSSSEAFEKMFERDKDELRSLGVPIEVGSMDTYFDDEPGYRIRPDEFALPDIDLTPDEASVVGLATRVWQHAKLADATTEAVRKLRALGAPVDVTALDIVEPRLSAEEPSFDAFWEATAERTPVVFGYRRPGQDEVTTRHLQPWGVTRYSGRWYVVGLDTDRGEERVFRLSRVEGEARPDGPAGSYDVPAGTDVSAVARRLAPAPVVQRAVLLVRRGAGHQLRRGAAGVETDVVGPDDHTTWDRVVLERDTLGLADEVLGHGADVCVEEPLELRAQVVERLRAGLDRASTAGGVA